MSPIQAQQQAIDYLLSSQRPNAYKIRRKASRLVADICRRCGYTVEQVEAAVKDMWDMYQLELNAED